MGSTASIKNHQKLKDFVSWFEIPVYNIQRASAFYNSIYNMEMEMNVGADYAMAYFPAEKGIGGALVAGPGCVPNATGVLIYLNAGNDMDSVLGRVELAGGRVIMPRTMISETAGSFALFIDSEGNRLALHEGAGEKKGSEKVAKARTQPKKAVAKTAKPAGPAKAKKTAVPVKKK
ncbi:MAG: VOC family protein [Flavobacteriales bacterium]|nr:VOC family protein [Flavobacteriales bacterium]MBP6642157.1 VOC family protein [Flavobacteriales bacterium]MBP7154396.1 VOC family protein [Flavobacteriales bacterium]HQV74150.1 VOC family protein [Flavobacteriales bacterium]HQW39722.1 VOC family protein [Flavobacteriales bacterium]